MYHSSCPLLPWSPPPPETLMWLLSRPRRSRVGLVLLTASPANSPVISGFFQSRVRLGLTIPSTKVGILYKTGPWCQNVGGHCWRQHRLSARLLFQEEMCALPSCEGLGTRRLEFSFFSWLLGVTQQRTEVALRPATEGTCGSGRVPEGGKGAPFSSWA